MKSDTVIGNYSDFLFVFNKGTPFSKQNGQGTAIPDLKAKFLWLPRSGREEAGNLLGHITI